MTKETILAKVMELNVGGTVDMYVYKELVDSLKQDIRDENNKQAGKSKPYKLAKAILAKGQKIQKNSSRTELMAYAFTDESGIKWVVDGYRIAGFYEELDLPEVPEEDRYRWFKLDNMLGAPYDDEEIIPPSIGEIKAEIKLKKAEKKSCMYVFTNGIGVNAQYLLEYLEGFTNPKLYPMLDRNGKISSISPLRIEADNGIGILLGIKHDKQESGFYSN